MIPAESFFDFDNQAIIHSRRCLRDNSLRNPCDSPLSWWRATWRVPSLKDSALVSGSLDQLIQKLTPKSKYLHGIESGIQDSDESTAFSNEVWSPKDHANSSVRSFAQGLDKHLLLKYGFISKWLCSRLLPCLALMELRR